MGHQERVEEIASLLHLGPSGGTHEETMMHRGFTFVWSLIFAVSPFWVSAKPIHRPMEMRGGCSHCVLNLPTKLDAIGGPPQQVVAVMEHGEALAYDTVLSHQQ